MNIKNCLVSDSRRGFTLIELLVVIAIIGLLSSIVLASLNTARAKGRDALRISNTQSLKLAAELYLDDNGTYPQYMNPDTGYSYAVVASYFAPKYIPVMPIDPQNLTTQYIWGNGGSGYGLFVYTEKSGWCKTGVNMNSGWYTSPPYPVCSF